MVFKQFRFNIVLRVLLLTSTCLALFITLNSTFTFTPILVAGLIIYQVWSLIRYVDRTNRELAGFLESIRYSEFTRTFQIMRPYYSLPAYKNLVIPLFSPRAKRTGGWRGGADPRREGVALGD